MVLFAVLVAVLVFVVVDVLVDVVVADVEIDFVVMRDVINLIHEWRSDVCFPAEDRLMNDSFMFFYEA